MECGFVHRGGSQLGHQQGAAQQVPVFRMARKAIEKTVARIPAIFLGTFDYLPNSVLTPMAGPVNMCNTSSAGVPTGTTKIAAGRLALIAMTAVFGQMPMHRVPITRTVRRQSGWMPPSGLSRYSEHRGDGLHPSAPDEGQSAGCHPSSARTLRRACGNICRKAEL
jgi:hypothetical protein